LRFSFSFEHAGHESAKQSQPPFCFLCGLLPNVASAGFIDFHRLVVRKRYIGASVTRTMAGTRVPEISGVGIDVVGRLR
jgi:hypothetical protein